MEFGGSISLVKCLWCKSMPLWALHFDNYPAPILLTYL